MGRLFVRIGKIFVVFLLILLCFLLWQGDGFLKINDDISSLKADAVVVLAGSADEDASRVLEAVSLIQAKRARYLILPLRHKALKWSWFAKNYGISAAIPGNKVYIGKMEPDDDLLRRYGGTFVEAKKTIRIMRRNNLKSAIVVSSGYHMRRAKMAFEKAREGSMIKLYYHPVDESLNNKKNVRYWGRMIKEYMKLAVAVVVY